MPTGTGKTITFLSLAKELNKKTLILVHREELMRQTYDKAKLCGFEESNISIISAEKKEKLTQLNIAMVQSLNRNLEKYSSDDIDLMIIDEAHHATANSYRNVMNHFKIFDAEKRLFGFTATPLRGDRDHLSDIFPCHSFKMTLSEATQLGYIVPVHGTRIEMNRQLAEIDNQQGDYDIQQLEKVMNCESVNNLVVERCRNLQKVPAIIFTTSVAHAEVLAKKLREAKRRAISVSYRTSKRTLAMIMRMLYNGQIDFITNAVKLSEGFDLPALRSVILARPTRSPVLYKQMIGRGLRNYKDKHECFVMEFTSNDPKMMCWEDIDEHSTFQSSSPEQRKTEADAKQHYRNLFKNPDVKIMDVRVSPFGFYECKIRRLIKYKNFYFTPFTEGFSFYQVKQPHAIPYQCRGSHFNLHGSMFFWKDHLKSFYAWGESDILMNHKDPQPIHELIKGMHHYNEINKLGRWYPSDLEPPTRSQKLLMHKYKLDWKTKSGRKAEMEIEEKMIKLSIDKYLSKGIFTGIMEID